MRSTWRLVPILALAAIVVSALLLGPGASAQSSGPRTLTLKELEEERVATHEREQVQRISSRDRGSIPVSRPNPVDRVDEPGDEVRVQRILDDQVAVAFEQVTLRVRESDPLRFAEHHGVPLASRRPCPCRRRLQTGPTLQGFPHPRRRSNMRAVD
jgi:hypothetical protein